MIYVEPRAGLCNRMRVIASAYTLAQKYNTKITVLWRESRGLKCSYNNLFCKQPLINVIETKHFINIKFMLNIMKCKRFFYNIKIDSLAEIENELIKNRDIYINTVYWFYEVKNYEMFEPINSIKYKIDNICRKYNMNTIGIHIRRTDNKEAIIHSPLELFLEFIEKEIQKNKEVKFYLSTDSKEIEKEISNKYSHYVITNANKVWGRDSKQGIEDALMDLGCLSRCDFIVGSYYSSFSETAAQWGIEKKLIVLSNLKDDY